MKSEVLKALKERRSVRSYESTPVPADLLGEILDAATYAPTGNGRQAPIMIAVTNREDRDEVMRLNAKVMGSRDADPYYGAPVIVLVLSSDATGTPVEDGANVLTYLMVAAEACGLSSVWVHREKEIFESAEGKALLAKWGIEGNYTGIVSIAIGYAKGEKTSAAARKKDYYHIV
ncbi:MAG: nitroreductase family protein [Mogibacterium sp.]|nr:nitroreductase family protein [Mogibacterium sp.]